MSLPKISKLKKLKVLYFIKNDFWIINSYKYRLYVDFGGKRNLQKENLLDMSKRHPGVG